MTDEIMFEGEPNYPPVIEDAPNSPAPIGEILWVDSTGDDLKIDVRVRDQNINQELLAHYRVLGEGERLAPFERKILAPGVLVRELQIVVDSNALNKDSCHRLELAVSGSFSRTQVDPNIFDVRPDDAQEDIDTAKWLLWEGKGETTASLEQKGRVVDSCNAIETFLGETSVVEDSP